MITTLIFLCLSMLDIQQMPPVPDSLEKQFTVTELREQALTGCTTSPQAGRPTNHQIFIDQHAAGPQDELPLGYINPLPLGAGADERNNAFPLVPAMMPYDPPGLPDPNPETPPVASTPEPPTVAILGISLGALMYLLFGRRKKERLYRRT